MDSRTCFSCGEYPHSRRVEHGRGQQADSGWVAPSFSGGWTNTASYTCGYRLIGNMVRLRGAITPGSGAAFTLPAGYFPTLNPEMTFIVWSTSAGAATVTVSNAGVVTPNQECWLDPISFWVD